MGKSILSSSEVLGLTEGLIFGSRETGGSTYVNHRGLFTVSLHLNER